MCLGGQGHLIQSRWPHHIPAEWPPASFSLPQRLHLKNGHGDSRPYLIELLWGLSELLRVECLEQYLLLVRAQYTLLLFCLHTQACTCSLLFLYTAGAFCPLIDSCCSLKSQMLLPTGSLPELSAKLPMLSHSHFPGHWSVFSSKLYTLLWVCTTDLGLAHGQCSVFIKWINEYSYPDGIFFNFHANIYQIRSFFPPFF